MIVQSDAAKRIAAWTKSAREEQGLRQDELALAAGVSPRTVFQVEQGKPTSRLDVISRILDALGLSLEIMPRPRTLSSDRTMNAPRAQFLVYQDAAGRFRWRLVTSNNRVVAVSEDAYQDRSAALHAVREVAGAAGNAEVFQTR